MPGRLVGMGKDHSGTPRIRADAVDARAAHPPREGDVEHLHESVAVRADGDDLPGDGRSEGLREIAEQNILKTDYAVSQIQATDEASRVLFPAPRFNEFVDRTFDRDAAHTSGTSAVAASIPNSETPCLLCVTETTPREQDRCTW